MLNAGKNAPALRWRAFFVFAAIFASSLHAAQPAGKPPELAQFGKPDAAEAARLLEQFRQAGIPGQFYLQFELRSLPRRGRERTFQGRLWGGRNEQGAIMRVELTDGSGAMHRLLIQNGERGAVWRVVDGRAVALSVTELFAPIIPGVEVSAFDLQMPYLYWPDATLEKVARSILGRPAHAYLVRAPANFTSEHPEIIAARAYLDTQFNALVQTELIGRDNRVVKTFAFLSLQKVEDRYIPKMADYRNETTRDKTRFQVTGAALNLRLPAIVFDAARLAQAVPPPPPAEIVRIDP
jgi:hypothetical protein